MLFSGVMKDFVGIARDRNLVYHGCVFCGHPSLICYNVMYHKKNISNTNPTVVTRVWYKSMLRRRWQNFDKYIIPGLPTLAQRLRDKVRRFGQKSPMIQTPLSVNQWQSSKHSSDMCLPQARVHSFTVSSWMKFDSLDSVFKSILRHNFQSLKTRRHLRHTRAQQSFSHIFKNEKISNSIES